MDGLHDVANVAGKRGGLKGQLSFVGCGTERGVYGCIYSAPPATKIVAAGDHRGDAITEVAAYLPPVKRSGLDVTSLAGLFVATFSPQLDRKASADLVKRLVSDAASARRRGEVAVGGVKYVLRANDGTDLRLYVTLDE